mmetsp:Transcript_9846/g.27858  ORF Transcript_9846/g.27858 Transcript_9846/m.27858 type:complete len:349 (+) Transcript_9846:559-1605(+)
MRPVHGPPGRTRATDSSPSDGKRPERFHEREYDERWGIDEFGNEGTAQGRNVLRHLVRVERVLQHCEQEGPQRPSGTVGRRNGPAGHRCAVCWLGLVPRPSRRTEANGGREIESDASRSVSFARTVGKHDEPGRRTSFLHAHRQGVGAVLQRRRFRTLLRKVDEAAGVRHAHPRSGGCRIRLPEGAQLLMDGIQCCHGQQPRIRIACSRFEARPAVGTGCRHQLDPAEHVRRRHLGIVHPLHPDCVDGGRCRLRQGAVRGIRQGRQQHALHPIPPPLRLPALLEQRGHVPGPWKRASGHSGGRKYHEARLHHGGVRHGLQESNFAAGRYRICGRYFGCAALQSHEAVL